MISAPRPLILAVRPTKLKVLSVISRHFAIDNNSSQLVVPLRFPVETYPDIFATRAKKWVNPRHDYQFSHHVIRWSPRFPRAEQIGCRATSPDLLAVFVWQLRFCPFFGECFHVVKGLVPDPRRSPAPLALGGDVLI